MKPPKARTLTTVPIPIGPGVMGSIAVPLDMTTAEKARFLRVVVAWLDLTADTPPDASHLPQPPSMLGG